MEAENNTSKWVALFGDFEASSDEVRFRGKRVPKASADQPQAAEVGDRSSVGLVLSNQTIADGDVSASIMFESVTPDTICEIAVPYDVNARHILAAGLGGESFAMFAIREFGSARAPNEWWDHRAAGERSALQPNRTYDIDVQFRGALVSLRIDGVLVGMTEVTAPVGRSRQVGIFCKGDHLITIRNFRTTSTKPKAFIVMQFGEQFDDVYNHVVKEICRDYDVKTLRADEVSGPGLIIADIVREISTAQLIIADITPTNANVYFEVGYALALGKPTILLARKGTPLPFDVAGFRVLFYEDSIGGKARMEENLRRHLEALLGLSA